MHFEELEELYYSRQLFTKCDVVIIVGYPLVLRVYLIWKYGHTTMSSNPVDIMSPPPLCSDTHTSV